jgi:hypothetical protein
MPRRRLRYQREAGAPSQAGAASAAGPSTSRRDAVPPAVLAALDALADAAPSLLRVPGPSGAVPAQQSPSALRRLLQLLHEASRELDGAPDLSEVSAASLLLPGIPVTLALLISQPFTPYASAPVSGRLRLMAEACFDGRLLAVRILSSVDFEPMGMPAPHISARLRSVYRSLVRAGMLSFAARNMAQAAVDLEATGPADPLSILPGLELELGARVALAAALAADAWPELAPAVDAAFEGSRVLDQAGRLSVQLLTTLGARRNPAWAGNQMLQREYKRLLLGMYNASTARTGVLSRRLARTEATATGGWPLHALLLFGVGLLNAQQPPGPTYGLPAELVAGAAELFRCSADGQGSDLATLMARAVVDALCTASRPVRGFSRRGLLTMALGLGRWAVAANAERRASGGEVVEEHSITAARAVIAAGSLLTGAALEAEWERQALADAWRLAWDAAATILLMAGSCFHSFACKELAEGIWRLLGPEVTGGKARQHRAVCPRASPHAPSAQLLCYAGGVTAARSPLRAR